jgi:hypothetical protein
MEQLLKDFAEGRACHDLTITYSDMHGLWGGVTVTLSSGGAYQRLERARGASVADVVRGTVAAARTQAIARLLLEIKAWEQRTQERAPVPDESRATLTLQSGDSETSIWERYNDLEENDRLVRVRSVLLDLAKEATI